MSNPDGLLAGPMHTCVMNYRITRLAGGVPPGRPRSTDATDAVRKASLDLAYECGIGGATVELISLRSGVAKTTIYRRWPNAAAVLMDAFLTEISPTIAYREHASIVDTFKYAASQLIVALSGQRGRLLCQLLGASQSDDELRQAFWNRWIEPRRKEGAEFLVRAQKRGELRASVNFDVLLDVIFGAIYYRLTIPYAPLDDQYIHVLIDQVFAGLLTEKG
ncbi:MAG: TetR family transcriptional regulator [Methylocystaceae bacterium]|nr:MAG: TetR family transcriptional regulator [Methylocystaceae bacterium]